MKKTILILLTAFITLTASAQMKTATVNSNELVMSMPETKALQAKIQEKSAELSNMPLQDKILELKHQTGKNILVGSRSLIIQLLNKNLIDEFQLCVHPLVEGKGLSLFDQIESRITFKLEKTKSLKSGVIVLYYKPISEN